MDPVVAATAERAPGWVARQATLTRPAVPRWAPVADTIHTAVRSRPQLSVATVDLPALVQAVTVATRSLLQHQPQALVVMEERVVSVPERQRTTPMLEMAARHRPTILTATVVRHQLTTRLVMAERRLHTTRQQMEDEHQDTILMPAMAGKHT